MSSNSKTEYNEFIRANLPAEITYDEVRAQYVTINGKRFPTYLQAKWYMDYIKKFGFSGFSVYAILSLEPPLVLDFDESYFRTNRTTTDLVSAATHTRAGNATMIDSDGFRKWAPHNLVTYSEQFDNAAWTKINGTATATTFTASADSNQHYVFNSATVPIGSTVTVKATVDARVDGRFLQVCFGSGDVSGNPRVNFDLSDGTISSDLTSIASIQATVTPGVYEITLEVLSAVTDFQVIVAAIESGSSPRLAAYDATGTTATYGVTKFHLYRSDLGGMVDNPATGDSYVPTTDAAKYLPRIGHHIWNGSAWVDAGYFHESEARTNLLLNSDTLATQSVTVTAVPHTLHFTGTGTVTLSGASTAGPLVGTGTGENNRVILTFTPTAGTLIVTVTGTVTNADLEVGSTPSSYIPTAGATVTRAADAMTIPAANLPWPEPVVIGPELVTNGTFDSDTDWNKGTGWTISGGVASFSNPSGTEMYQTLPLPAGVYKIEVDATGNGCSVYFNSPSISKTVALSSGSNVVYLVHNGSYSKFSFLGAGGNSFSIDNISVREINPLAVSIQMEGTMTYADEGGLIGQPYVWTLNSSNFISPYWESPSTLTGRILFRQSESGVVDSVISSNVLSPGINVPFNIASRHGSTFINGAVDGTALTANLTPTALPYLENTDMQVGYDFNGTIKLFRVWADDLTDEGIAEGSSND